MANEGQPKLAALRAVHFLHRLGVNSPRPILVSEQSTTTVVVARDRIAAEIWAEAPASVICVKHPIAAVVGSAILVFALAGCAAPTPAHTHTHAAGPTITPSPTATAASEPGSRVPLGCSGLLSSSASSALAGATAKLATDEHSAPTNIPSIAQLQFGALSCVWDGTTTVTATSPGSLLEVDVAPDSATLFNSRFAAIMADQSMITHPAAIEGIAGTTSGYWCSNTLDALGADANLPICDAEMLASNYWVSIQVSTVTAFTRAQLVAGITAALTDIAGELKASGPPPGQWSAPSTTPPKFCSASTSTATVRSIIGNSTLEPLPNNSSIVYASTVGLVGVQALCAWSSSSSGIVAIDALAGGSWAFPSLSPTAPVDAIYASQPYTSMTVTGASSAEVACGAGACDAYMAVGTSAVEVTFVDPGAAKRPVELAGFAKAIAAS